MTHRRDKNSPFDSNAIFDEPPPELLAGLSQRSTRSSNSNHHAAAEDGAINNDATSRGLLTQDGADAMLCFARRSHIEDRLRSGAAGKESSILLAPDDENGAAEEEAARPPRVSIEPGDILPPPPQEQQQEEQEAPPHQEQERQEQQKQIVNPYLRRQEEDSARRKHDAARAYAKKIFDNPNHANTFGEKGKTVMEATSTTAEYSKRVASVHRRFEEIVREATAPRGNDDGDVQLHRYFTNKVDLPDGLRQDLEFYAVVGGEPEPFKKQIANQALCIWTLNIKKMRVRGSSNAQSLDTSTHATYIKYVFTALAARGVRYKSSEFNGKGGFLGVCKADWNKKREADPSIGTKRNKARFDEHGDQKYLSKLEDGTYKPFDDDLDLMKVIAMELGRQFGLRGKTELVFLKWSDVSLGTYDCGVNKGLRHVTISPCGGDDKANKISVLHPTVNTQKPMVVEQRENKYCIVKLIFHYRTLCHPNQKRFFCYVNNRRRKSNPYHYRPNSQIGGDPIREWIKEFAKVAGFTDFDKFTPHDNRHRCITALASNENVTDKMRMNHVRHKNAKSAEPYIHDNSTIQNQLQTALRDGVSIARTSCNNKENTAPTPAPPAAVGDEAPVQSSPTNKLALKKEIEELKKKAKKRKNGFKEASEEAKKQHRKELQDIKNDNAELTTIVHDLEATIQQQEKQIKHMKDAHADEVAELEDELDKVVDESKRKLESSTKCILQEDLTAVKRELTHKMEQIHMRLELSISKIREEITRNRNAPCVIM